jgi:RND family efflux transporter MFP subunit
MDFVDNQLDPSTGTIVARAEIPNPDLTLAPGLFARLRLVGSGKFQAVLIPDAAIGSDQSQKFVYVVDGENRAQYRQIKTAALIDGMRVVREGLTTEEWVVTSGIQRVKPGQPVDAERKALQPPPATPAATPAATPPATPPATPTPTAPATPTSPEAKPDSSGK